MFLRFKRKTVVRKFQANPIYEGWIEIINSALNRTGYLSDEADNLLDQHWGLLRLYLRPYIEHPDRPNWSEKDVLSGEWPRVRVSNEIVRRTFVPGRLVPGFETDDGMEEIVRQFVEIWRGVVGSSIYDGPDESAKHWQRLHKFMSEHGIILRAYLEPYRNLMDLVGKDQIRQFSSIRVGIPDDEQNRWCATIGIRGYERNGPQRVLSL